MKAQGPSFAAKIVLSSILSFVLCVFIFSLLKNIQYPLLWNDESETAMYAKRILQYGYPKIHDGKNVVWLTECLDKTMGLDKKRDSPNSLVWGQYYFAAIGEFFAQKVDNIYLKTALLRIPFALAGLAGLFIMALSIMGLFGENIFRRLTFLIIFFSLSLSSIALTLHLREARHPALVVLLSACIFYVYFNYRFYNKIKPAQYMIGLTFCLFALYHVFHVVCFIFFAAILSYEFIALLKERSMKSFLGNITPVLIAGMLVIPFFIFSQTFEYGRVYRLAHSTYMLPWTTQISGILRFFQKYELFYLLLTVKMVFFCLWAYCSKKQLEPEAGVIKKMRISGFLSLFFSVYIFIIALFPSSIIYQRYYVALISVATMILLLDLFGAFELISQIPYKAMQNRIKQLCAAAFLLVLSLSISGRIDHMQGHAYELFHQYSGPLDFAIPFIKSHYNNTENLIIATNYEELAYMYYLGSKTIVGFNGNNIDEDAKMRPDIVIFRKERNPAYLEVLNNFLLTYRYEKISFPVLDYFVNNIPELKYHLYLTPTLNGGQKCLDIFIRSDGGMGEHAY